MIQVTLSAGNMGNVTPADFDAWAMFVADNLAAHIGRPELTIDVDQFRFGDACADRVRGAGDDLADAIHEALSHTLWDDFCGTPEAWPSI